MKGRIALLIPTFNGGDLLRQTVESVLRAGLPAGGYRILVCDNCSTDGSVDSLPEDAAVFVHRNDANLGRIGNWNAAMAVAETMGFSFAMYLMVGDLLEGQEVIALRDRMERQDAALGIACYRVVDPDLRPLRLARRICWRGDPERGIEAGRFLAQSLATGAMLFGPLGANLYRIDGGVGLRFDDADQTHTDQLATALFTQAAGKKVVYLDRPISSWRQRPGRFHAGITAEQRIEGDLRVIKGACRPARIAIDYEKLGANLLLRCLVYTRGNVALAWRASRALTDGAWPSWRWLMTLLCRQLHYQTPWMMEV